MENNNIHSLILENSIFKIGNVFSVDGREVKIKIDKKKNLSHLIYKGTLIKNVSVGSYVKIAKGYINIIAKVEGEYIKEDIYQDSDYNSKENLIERILRVKLLGYVENETYYKGIKELPLLDNECFLLNNDEFDLIHLFAEDGDKSIQIGTLLHDERQLIKLGVNKLFSSHVGIFGNTGSGKSYTLAKIYRQLFLEFENHKKFKNNAKFLLFDFNGEYSARGVICDNKKSYILSTRDDTGKDKLIFNKEDFLKPEIFHILASASEKTQQPFIDRTLKFYTHIHKKDNPLDYFKNILRKQIKEILCMTDRVKAELLISYVEQILPAKIERGLDIGLRADFAWHTNQKIYYALEGPTYFNNNPEKIEKLIIYQQVNNFVFSDDFIEQIIAFLYLQLILDVLSNRAANEHIAPAINKLKSFQKDFNKIFTVSLSKQDFWDKNYFCVVDMNNVNTKMKKLIPLLLSTKLYAEHKQTKKNQTTKSLNIIIDEAHNILSYESQRESESWKDFRLETFEEIIKEGRKFGVFLTIASQRPSDISHTIVSQLHNYFIHRLVNNKDLEMIERSISYLDKLSVEALSILPTGSCVLSGVIAQMPIVIQIDRIEEKHKPYNETINLLDKWM